MPTSILSVDSTTASPSVRISLTKFREGVGIICTIPDDESATYSVQVSGDDSATADADKQWNEHDIISGATTSKNSNLAYPCTHVRLKASVVSDKVYMAVIQVEG